MIANKECFPQKRLAVALMSDSKSLSFTMPPTSSGATEFKLIDQTKHKGGNR